MPIKKGTPKLLSLKRRIRTNPTRAEQLLWAKLRHNQIYGLKFRRQHGIGSYIVDFFCPERSLVIEVDGDVHAIETQHNKDLERENYLTTLGLQILRYTNDEIFNNLNGVLEDLALRLSTDSTSPIPGMARPAGRDRCLQRREKLKNGLPGKTLLGTTLGSKAFITKEENPLNNSNPLSREFYDRPTLKIAKDLLGKVLIRNGPNGFIQTKIVDVEAYVGPKDKACHASKGRTKRTEIMFGPGGFTYVYLIYGMYHCLNIVTEQEEYPAAILIRGLELLGEEDIPARHTRIDGPGRVCRFLDVDRTHNGLDATLGTTLWIEDHGLNVSRKQIQALPRIGVDYAGEWAKKLWRFCLPAPHSRKPRRTMAN